MRKFMLLSLLLAFCVVALPARAARADSKYTIDSLTQVLLTGDELTTALGPGLTDTVEIDPSTNPVSVGRGYTDADDGDFININLFSPDDGSAIAKSDSDHILSGDFIKAATKGYSNVTNFQVQGPAVDRDMVATFTGTVAGATYNVSGLSFVRGNIFGIIFYSTPANNDPTILGLVYGAQLAKLPS